MKTLKPAELRKLARLQAMAKMKSDAELAKLATVAQSRSRLINSIKALNATEAPLDGSGDARPDAQPDAQPDASPGAQVAGPAAQPAVTDPAMLRARLAHARWAEGRKRLLNQRLALVNAEYLARQPAAAKAFGRAEVLGRLVSDGWVNWRRDQNKP
ncbi:MAG: hypothetical protein ACK4LQ_00365 [Pararhodobacter sp.]